MYIKKCIIVSDSFKGTLSSLEICSIAQNTIPHFFPGCQVLTIPVADGGEGTVDCFVQAMNAQPVQVRVTNALGEKCMAAYARIGDQAIIEIAAAAGLPQVGDRRDPEITTTYGVGEMIAHAVENGCTKLLLGLGGSATNDGGCGCAAALGVKFYDADGNSFIPVGGTLKDIHKLDVSQCAAFLSDIDIQIMCDVTNPLCGERGAAHVFGPQKGADREMVLRLDAGLQHYGTVLENELGFSVREMPGAGAAGGMGAGCVALLGATLRSGIDAVLDAVDFDAKLEGTDLVITGEGRIDSQSLGGKVISGVSSRTRRSGIPLIAIVGCIHDSASAAYDIGISAIFSTNRASLPVEQLADRSARDYEATLRDILRLLALK